MDYDNNTNIRFHIFKELSKHRKNINKTNLERVNDFAIPVFAGVSTTLLTKTIETEFISDSIYRIIFYLIAPALLYLIIYNFSRFIIKHFKNNFLPYWRQTKTKDYESLKEEQEENIARFDYEVSNLVHSSYALIIEKNSNQLLHEYNLMQSILYATNAVKNIEKSLLPNKLSIPCSRIDFILRAINKTILLQLECKGNEKFNNEILNIISSYNSLIETINDVYNLDINKIETTLPNCISSL